MIPLDRLLCVIYQNWGPPCPIALRSPSSDRVHTGPHPGTPAPLPTAYNAPLTAGGPHGTIASEGGPRLPLCSAIASLSADTSTSGPPPLTLAGVQRLVFIFYFLMFFAGRLILIFRQFYPHVQVWEEDGFLWGKILENVLLHNSGFEAPWEKLPPSPRLLPASPPRRTVTGK